MMPNVNRAPDDDAVAENDIFFQFAAQSNETPLALPAELIPRRHQEPTWNDSTIHSPDLSVIFTADLTLTDLNEGVRSQKINRNITEMAEAICHRCYFASIGDQLAIYQPPCWKIMNQQKALAFIVEETERLFRNDAKYLSARQYKELLFQVLHCESTKNLREVPAPNHNYLCCRDYLYDWHSRECIPHDSSFLRFSFLALDAEEIGACNGDHWEQFLDDLTGGDTGLRQRVLEVIGVILSGYPSKSFFLLEGESGTGKSQLANFLRDVLGESACFALNDISQLGDKWTTGSIFGKLLCLCGDVPDAPLKSAAIGTIKQLTGGDLIRGELKYKDAFTFDNTAKLLFVSNYPLRISEKHREQALLDRLVVIPCRNPVPRDRQIPDLHKRLHQEAGYIVDLAMDALERLEARNGVFTPLPPEFDNEAIQAPDAERDIVDFVRDCCLLEENTACTTAELFEAFRQYAYECPIDITQFSKMLLRLFNQVKSSRTKSARGYRGIRLNSSE